MKKNDKNESELSKIKIENIGNRNSLNYANKEVKRLSTELSSHKKQDGKIQMNALNVQARIAQQ